MFTHRIERHPTDPDALLMIVLVLGTETTYEVRDAAFVAAVIAAGKVTESIDVEVPA